MPTCLWSGKYIQSSERALEFILLLFSEQTKEKKTFDLLYATSLSKLRRKSVPDAGLQPTTPGPSLQVRCPTNWAYQPIVLPITTLLPLLTFKYWASTELSISF